MAGDTHKITTVMDDPYNTVWYGNGKFKRYYNPDTKHYRIFDNKSYTKLWTDFDYYKYTEGNVYIMSALLILLSNINGDSIVTRKDKHTRKRLAVNSKKELAELLHINYNSGSGREKLKALFDLNVLFEAKITVNKDLKLSRFYLNPLIGMQNQGVSLDCYMNFRDIIKPELTARAVENLDNHVIEEYDTIKIAVPVEEENV
jgi:hypothetical protein